MKREHFDQMLANASKSVQAINKPFADLDNESPVKPVFESPLAVPEYRKRLRQDSKPLMNKLEQEWLTELERRYGVGKVRSQAKKYKLANGCWFLPDFCVTVEFLGGRTQETCFEVKGKHAWEDSLVKLKVAAHQWPEIRWVLAWKDNGTWREQQVLP